MSITQWRTVFCFKLDGATTYADTRSGHKDKDKRANIRENAIPHIGGLPPDVRRWGFRIHVAKGGNRRFDIENVPKLIVDSFSRKQIKSDNDGESHGKAGLYADDTIDYVGYIEIAGERTKDDNWTLVEVLAEMP